MLPEVLKIGAKEDTPEVYLSVSDISVIRGRSLPENAYEFYEPILEWFEKFSQSAVKDFTLVFHFDYFNSSSGRYIYEILHKLDRSTNRGYFKVIWKHEKEDDLMLERGELLQSLCSIAFEFVVIEG